MNVTIGESGEKALEFSELLKEKTGLPIEMWDERLTTVAAHRAMLEADLSRNKRKKIVDFGQSNTKRRLVWWNRM